RLILFKLRSRSERLLDDRIQGGVGINQRERGKVQIRRHKFDGRIEAQYLREPSAGDALLFDNLAQRELIALLLHSHAQSVAFERKTGFDGALDLSVVIGGNLK